MRMHLLILALALLLCSCAEGATKIGMDRLNWSQIGVINVQDYGAAGDGMTDDAKAVQDASDAAYALWAEDGNMRTVYIPSGVYLINSSQEDAEILLKPRPGVQYRGAGMGQTIIRAPPEWRDASNGVSLFFNDDEYLTGLEVTDITFDYGTEVFVPGDAFATRIGATHIKDAIFERVEVLNASGSWCFVFGSGTEDGFSENVQVKDCRFINSGDSKAGDATEDFTCIYMSAANSSITNCQFLNDALMACGTAIEFHNSGIIARHNLIKNFSYGAHLGAQKDTPSTSTGQVFSDNVIYATTGIDYWTTTSTDVWQDAVISGNTIYLMHRNPEDLLSGIGTGIHNGGAYNITITGNKILNYNGHGGTYASTGITLFDVNSGTIANNEIINTTRGIQFQYVENLTDIVITGNTVRGWGYGFSNGIYTPAFQLDFSRTTDGGKVIVANNVALANGYPHYGIVVWGQNLAYLDIRNNDINGVATTDILLSGSYTDEKVCIDHRSWKGGPNDVYASDSSTWINMVSDYYYRRSSSTWSKVAWSYA